MKTFYAQPMTDISFGYGSINAHFTITDDGTLVDAFMCSPSGDKIASIYIIENYIHIWHSKLHIDNIMEQLSTFCSIYTQESHPEYFI